MQPCIRYCQIGTAVRWRWLGNCYCCSVLVLVGMVTDVVVPFAFNASFPCFRLLITDEPWLKGSNENCMLHVMLFVCTIPDIWLPICECDQRTIWNAARSVDLTVVAVFLFLLWSLAIWCFCLVENIFGLCGFASTWHILDRPIKKKNLDQACRQVRGFI